MTEAMKAPMRFLLAGSGHIAGVVNPPSSGKYQYWTFDGKAASLDEFIEKASETQGSWWPDWMEWIRPHARSEEHTSELQSLMRISYAVSCLKKKNQKGTTTTHRFDHCLAAIRHNVLRAEAHT